MKQKDVFNAKGKIRMTRIHTVEGCYLAHNYLVKDIVTSYRTVLHGPCNVNVVTCSKLHSLDLFCYLNLYTPCQ